MLTDYFETIWRLAVEETPDGFGGTVKTVTKGDTFQGGIILNNTVEQQIAYQNGAAKQYTLVTDKYVGLKRGDLLKGRKGTYRVTSDAEDMATPKIAILSYHEATMEAIEL